MEIERFDIDGPAVLSPARLGDERGFFSETYRADRFRDAVGNYLFVQDNHSLSARRGTIRGLHYQMPPRAQAKLVRCVRGAVLDVAVDIRCGSPTYGQHVAVELSAQNWRQFFIPLGFLHGFCTLVDDTEIMYKVTDFYSPEHDAGVAWNDPDIAIAWPPVADDALLSNKDRSAPLLRDIRPAFQFADASTGAKIIRSIGQ